MIIAASLAPLALVAIGCTDQPKAYRGQAIHNGRAIALIVLPHQEKVVSDAIDAGAGQPLIVRLDKGVGLLAGSRDDVLAARLNQAETDDCAARRAADPLGHAEQDLAWAQQMLNCAYADVELGRAPADDWVQRHEDKVAELTQLVATHSV
ncbi:hypothetical protein [Sphingosinicella sp. BN140058]|uniref:hypothetical protein n=1 Tax=Sphingosinicella sp. BN140058 TaxID=1892855 RepID=UPI001013B2FA|nr:hypothetical protein [Sphingosinicella sp. BN140058]QAY80226.1 hypothetical protein ETR14_26650 [Sphingosinicella sp. BN140058]